MAQPASIPIPPETYLAEERAREGRAEYVNGVVYAMAGASLAHVRIVSDLSGALNQGLAGTGCEAVSSDLRIKAAGTTMYTYPDVVVFCENARFEDDQMDTLLDPIVLVEVLSPSTEAYDRGAKWAHYQTIPSLRHYLLVAQSEIRIEHYARQSERSWIMTAHTRLEERISLDSPEVTIEVKDVYRRVGVEPGGLPKGKPG